MINSVCASIEQAPVYIYIVFHDQKTEYCIKLNQCAILKC